MSQHTSGPRLGRAVIIALAATLLSATAGCSQPFAATKVLPDMTKAGTEGPLLQQFRQVVQRDGGGRGGYRVIGVAFRKPLGWEQRNTSSGEVRTRPVYVFFRRGAAKDKCFIGAGTIGQKRAGAGWGEMRFMGWRKNHFPDSGGKPTTFVFASCKGIDTSSNEPYVGVAQP